MMISLTSRRNHHRAVAMMETILVVLKQVDVEVVVEMTMLTQTPRQNHALHHFLVRSSYFHATLRMKQHIAPT